jgi:hypothetical protein
MTNTTITPDTIWAVGTLAVEVVMPAIVWAVMWRGR